MGVASRILAELKLGACSSARTLPLPMTSVYSSPGLTWMMSGTALWAVRTATAQPGLYPMCQCEARSTVGTIASRFDECLGEDTGAGRGCEYGRCANMCEGLTAICSSEGRCVLAEDGTEAEDAS